MIGVWDHAAGRQLRAISTERRILRSIAFSTNNELLATGGDDSALCLWDTPRMIDPAWSR